MFAMCDPQILATLAGFAGGSEDLQRAHIRTSRQRAGGPGSVQAASGGIAPALRHEPWPSVRTGKPNPGREQKPRLGRAALSSCLPAWDLGCLFLWNYPRGLYGTRAPHQELQKGVSICRQAEAHKFKPCDCRQFPTALECLLRSGQQTKALGPKCARCMVRPCVAR